MNFDVKETSTTISNNNKDKNTKPSNVNVSKDTTKTYTVNNSNTSANKETGTIETNANVNTVLNVENNSEKTGAVSSGFFGWFKKVWDIIKKSFNKPIPQAKPVEQKNTAINENAKGIPVIDTSKFDDRLDEISHEMDECENKYLNYAASSEFIEYKELLKACEENGYSSLETYEASDSFNFYLMEKMPLNIAYEKAAIAAGYTGANKGYRYIIDLGNNSQENYDAAHVKYDELQVEKTTLERQKAESIKFQQDYYYSSIQNSDEYKKYLEVGEFDAASVMSYLPDEQKQFYNYMSDDQKQFYAYMYETYSPEAALKYFETIDEYVKAAKGQEMALEKLESLKAIKRDENGNFATKKVITQEQQIKLDENGFPMLDSNGEYIYEMVDVESEVYDIDMNIVQELAYNYGTGVEGYLKGCLKTVEVLSGNVQDELSVEDYKDQYFNMFILAGSDSLHKVFGNDSFAQGLQSAGNQFIPLLASLAVTCACVKGGCDAKTVEKAAKWTNLGMMTLGSYGNNFYNSYYKNGNKETSYVYAAGSALIEIGTECINDVIPGLNWLDDNNVINGKYKKLIVKRAKDTVSEIGEEWVGMPVQYLLDKLCGLDPEKLTVDDLVNSAISTTVSTIAMNATSSSMMIGFNAYNNLNIIIDAKVLKSPEGSMVISELVGFMNGMNQRLSNTALKTLINNIDPNDAETITANFDEDTLKRWNALCEKNDFGGRVTSSETEVEKASESKTATMPNYEGVIEEGNKTVESLDTPNEASKNVYTASTVQELSTASTSEDVVSKLASLNVIFEDLSLKDKQYILNGDISILSEEAKASLDVAIKNPDININELIENGTITIEDAKAYFKTPDFREKILDTSNNYNLSVYEFVLENNLFSKEEEIKALIDIISKKDEKYFDNVDLTVFSDLSIRSLVASGKVSRSRIIKLSKQKHDKLDQTTVDNYYAFTEKTKSSDYIYDNYRRKNKEKINNATKWVEDYEKALVTKNVKWQKALIRRLYTKSGSHVDAEIFKTMYENNKNKVAAASYQVIENAYDYNEDYWKLNIRNIEDDGDIISRDDAIANYLRAKELRFNKKVVPSRKFCDPKTGIDYTSKLPNCDYYVSEAGYLEWINGIAFDVDGKQLKFDSMEDLYGYISTNDLYTKSYTFQGVGDQFANFVGFGGSVGRPGDAKSGGIYSTTTTLQQLGEKYPDLCKYDAKNDTLIIATGKIGEFTNGPLGGVAADNNGLYILEHFRKIDNSSASITSLNNEGAFIEYGGAPGILPNGDYEIILDNTRVKLTDASGKPLTFDNWTDLDLYDPSSITVRDSSGNPIDSSGNPIPPNESWKYQYDFSLPTAKTVGKVRIRKIK